MVVARCDERRHVEGLPVIGVSAADEALAFPLAGLARDGSEAGERHALLILEVAKLGHRGHELIGGQRSHAGDANEDLAPAGECSIGGDHVGYLGVEHFDVPIDLVKPVPPLSAIRQAILTQLS